MRTTTTTTKTKMAVVDISGPTDPEESSLRRMKRATSVPSPGQAHARVASRRSMTRRRATLPTPSAWLNGAEAAAAAGGSAPGTRANPCGNAENPRQRLPSRRPERGAGDDDGGDGEPPLPDFVWDPADIVGAYAALFAVRLPSP